MQTTFFYLERFLKKLAGDQCSSITKGSIFLIKHMYIQPFTTVVDWPKTECWMEVSTMFYICRYFVFTHDRAAVVFWKWFVSTRILLHPPNNYDMFSFSSSIPNYVHYYLGFIPTWDGFKTTNKTNKIISVIQRYSLWEKVCFIGNIREEKYDSLWLKMQPRLIYILLNITAV